MPAPAPERLARSTGDKHRLKPWWVAAAAIASVVAFALSGIPGGTFAFWSETASQPTSVISAGAITAGSAIAPSPAATFSAGTTEKTGGLTITNAGTSDATYSTATTASGSTPLASGIQVSIWPSTVAAGCETPIAPATGTWASFPVLTGSLAAGASQFYCVKTNLTTPVGLASNTSVTATFTTTMNRNSWRSTSTATVAQNFVDAAPSVPTNLTFSGTTTSSTTLNWTASTDDVAVTGYDIYNGSTLVGSTTGATSYSITGLASSSTYTYAVRAKDGAAHTSTPASASVTTLTATPPTSWSQLVNTKSGLCIDAKGAGTTNFAPLVQNTCSNPASTNQTWQFQTATAGYYTVVPRHTSAVVWDIEAASGSNAARVILYGPHGGVNQQWTVRLVAPDTYQFMARNSSKCMSVIGGSTAIDVGYEQVDCNAADPAQTFSFRTVDTTAPTAPVLSGTLSGTTASLSWSASTDAVGVTGYVIYRNGAQVGTTTASVRTFSNTGLTAGNTYTYTVRARDAAGNLSALSNSVAVSTVPALTCASSAYPSWMATYSWTTPTGVDLSTLKYNVYVNNVRVTNVADGWNSYVQLTSSNIPTTIPTGRSTVSVMRIMPNGSESPIGTGVVDIQQFQTTTSRTFACG